MSRVVIGIDPGLTGALAWLLDRGRAAPALLEVRDIPTAEVKSGRKTRRHVLLPVLADMLRPETSPLADLGLDGLPLHVVVEEVHAAPGQGVVSMFRFGETFGAIQGVVAALQIPVSFLPPAKWQGLVRVRKDDEASRLRASQLFPEHARFFARKMDHNRADAALIGYAGVLSQARDLNPPTVFS